VPALACAPLAASVRAGGCGLRGLALEPNCPAARLQYFKQSHCERLCVRILTEAADLFEIRQSRQNVRPLPRR